MLGMLQTPHSECTHSEPLLRGDVAFHRAATVQAVRLSHYDEVSDCVVNKLNSVGKTGEAEDITLMWGLAVLQVLHIIQNLPLQRDPLHRTLKSFC